MARRLPDPRRAHEKEIAMTMPYPTTPNESNPSERPREPDETIRQPIHRPIPNDPIHPPPTHPPREPEKPDERGNVDSQSKDGDRAR
jgi:hypothetical protein